MHWVIIAVYPYSAALWIRIYDVTQNATAPGGEKLHRAGNVAQDDTVGAIDVDLISSGYTSTVVITRPNYNSLGVKQASISSGNVIEATP
jgi:hypothetical protein